MKLALPIFVLFAILALTSAKSNDDRDDDNLKDDREKDKNDGRSNRNEDKDEDVDLNDWIATGGIDDDVVTDFKDDIDDCIHETHTHGMFYHCIDDHLHYYDSDELTSKQKREILRKAQNSHVHESTHGGPGRHGPSRKLRGL
jgi:hypothetical protein